jgi:hypothetical protein
MTCSTRRLEVFIGMRLLLIGLTKGLRKAFLLGDSRRNALFCKQAVCQGVSVDNVLMEGWSLSIWDYHGVVVLKIVEMPGFCQIFPKGTLILGIISIHLSRQVLVIQRLFVVENCCIDFILHQIKIHFWYTICWIIQEYRLILVIITLHYFLAFFNVNNLLLSNNYIC